MVEIEFREERVEAGDDADDGVDNVAFNFPDGGVVWPSSPPSKESSSSRTTTRSFASPLDPAPFSVIIILEDEGDRGPSPSLAISSSLISKALLSLFRSSSSKSCSTPMATLPLTFFRPPLFPLPAGLVIPTPTDDGSDVWIAICRRSTRLQRKLSSSDSSR